MFSVVTYNILSPTLVNSLKASNKNKKPSFRLKRIKKKLGLFIEQKSIICLQEVGQDWVGSLKNFLLENNYTVFSTQYGNKFDNYMGVLTAIPNHINIIDVDIVKPNKKVRIWDNQYNTDDLETAQRKNNSMILVCISIQNKKCLIVNYHIRCNFRNRDLMKIHFVAAARTIEEYYHCDCVCTIWSGDFNIKPDSSIYKNLFDKFGYCSAYGQLYGEQNTTFNYTNHHHERFEGCLDYILYNGYVDLVSAIDNGPDYIQMSGDFDLMHQPSDHLPLCATFSLW